MTRNRAWSDAAGRAAEETVKGWLSALGYQVYGAETPTKQGIRRPDIAVGGSNWFYEVKAKKSTYRMRYQGLTKTGIDTDCYRDYLRYERANNARVILLILHKEENEVVYQVLDRLEAYREHITPEEYKAPCKGGMEMWPREAFDYLCTIGQMEQVAYSGKRAPWWHGVPHELSELKTTHIKAKRFWIRGKGPYTEQEARNIVNDLMKKGAAAVVVEEDV